MTAPTPADVARTIRSLIDGYRVSLVEGGDELHDYRPEYVEAIIAQQVHAAMAAAQAAPRAADAAAPDWVEGAGTCPCGHPVTQHDATVAHPCRRVGCPCGAAAAEVGRGVVDAALAEVLAHLDPDGYAHSYVDGTRVTIEWEAAAFKALVATVRQALAAAAPEAGR